MIVVGCTQELSETPAIGDDIDEIPAISDGTNEIPSANNATAGGTNATGEELNVSSPPDIPESALVEKVLEQVTWQFIEEWAPRGNPPDCPDPLILQTPVDIRLVTSVLYPGQSRGGNYKPHGGFRFDNAESNEILIRAPLDGYLLDGSRYLVGGELQYTIDIVNPCGIMYRFGHLSVLSPKFVEVAETFPQPLEGDSRTTQTDPIPVKAGEVVATEVGMKKNVFVDWGVYDLRRKNDASKDRAWAQEHGGDQAPYAVCWLDMLSPEDAAKIRDLPGADQVSGKQSDYCI